VAGTLFLGLSQRAWAQCVFGAQSSQGLRDAVPIGHMGCDMKLIDVRKSANYCRADEAFLRHINYQEGQPRQSSRPDCQDHVIPRLSLFRSYVDLSIYQ
jgi:hypothetical protein